MMKSSEVIDLSQSKVNTSKSRNRTSSKKSSSGKKQKQESYIAPLFEETENHVVPVHVSANTVKRYGQDWLPAGVKRGAKDFSLECHGNNVITLQLDVHTIWRREVFGRVVLIVANEDFVAVATTHVGEGGNSLHVFNLFSGGLAVPRLALPSYVAGMQMTSASQLLYVGVSGEVCIWDLQKKSNTLKTSASDIFSGPGAHPTLAHCFVRENSNIPVLIMNNGTAFAFDHKMQAWMCIHDAKKYWESDFASSFPSSTNSELFGKEEGKAVLMQIQAFANDASVNGLTTGASHFLLEGGRGNNKLASNYYHLEHQIMSSDLLKSMGELSYWIQTYVTQLVDRLGMSLGMANLAGPKPDELLRLKHLCEWLLGERNDESLEAKQKRLIFKSYVLPILSTQQALQYLVTKYQTELKKLE